MVEQFLLPLIASIWVAVMIIISELLKIRKALEKEDD